MGTEKRARQKAGRQARIEAAEAARQRAAQRSRMIRIGVIAAVVVVLLGTYAFFQRDKDPAVETGSPSSSTTTTANGSVPPATGAPVTVPGAAVKGDTPCPSADGSAQRTTTFEKPPPMCIDPAKTYTAKVSTTKGDFTITLDPKSAPKAANNFITLARYHYYDGVGFHRIIPDFVIQGGDPQGTGNGGPGYQFEDELPSDKAVYQPGTVAMANSGPNSNGSQFFIVLAPDRLDTKYSLFGKVTEGFDTTIQAIARTGTGGGTPTDPTTINSVTITES